MLAEAAEVVYHSSSWQVVSDIWQTRSIINIKLAAKMMNMAIPFWDSPATGACGQDWKQPCVLQLCLLSSC